jgi:hypothetical protein
MPLRIIFALVILFFVSCKENKLQPTREATGNPAVDSAAIVNDPLNNVNVQTNAFKEIDSSGILMFPLPLTLATRGSSGFSSGSYSSNYGGSYWNIIFLNTHTNEYHILSDKKIFIKSYDLHYHNSDNENISIPNPHIFYSVIAEDYNKDKTLDFNDPGYLFTSDKEGNNFKQVSPSHCDLQNWEFIKASNKVIMTVIKDSDKNNKFDEKDELATFEMDIDKDTEAKEVFATDFKNKLKILFDKDWKQVKK